MQACDLGFAIGTGAQIEALSEALGPRSVLGPALAIGAATMTDTHWIDVSSRRLIADSKHLDIIMAASIGPAIGGTHLFRLYDTGKTDLHCRLAGKGIWTRVFSDHPKLIRLGLPPENAAFECLAATLD